MYIEIFDAKYLIEVTYNLNNNKFKCEFVTYDTVSVISEHSLLQDAIFEIAVEIRKKYYG